MKAFVKKNRWKLLILAAAYLVSLAFCILILASVPYLSHRAFLTRTLGEAARAVFGDRVSGELRALRDRRGHL